MTGSGLPRLAIVTAQVWDDEMAARVAQHRTQRGPGWTVVDEPHDLPGALDRSPTGAAVLVDCLTLWLTNQLLADADLGLATEALIAALARASGPVVLVTNEVGLSIVPENALARRFRDEQGRLNQRIAGVADLVAGVMAGLPFALKGALP